MGEDSIVNSRYTYIHDHKWPSEAIDLHHVIIRKRRLSSFFICFSVCILIANSSYIFLVKEKPITILFSSLLLSAFLIIFLRWEPVEKESVVVLPAFGVQLETHYGSILVLHLVLRSNPDENYVLLRGRVIRRFVPISKVLKPVLTECVTPVTCYWSLSLIVRGDEELMLVFKDIRPPVKMLIPIWKALCAATDNQENLQTTS